MPGCEAVRRKNAGQSGQLAALSKSFLGCFEVLGGRTMEHAGEGGVSGIVVAM